MRKYEIECNYRMRMEIPFNNWKLAFKKRMQNKHNNFIIQNHILPLRLLKHHWKIWNQEYKIALRFQCIKLNRIKSIMMKPFTTWKSKVL